MEGKHFTEEQISYTLRQAESGMPVAEICLKLKVTETSFYRWKEKDGGLGGSELRELRQLCEENRKLKQLVADLSLDKHVLGESLKKNPKTGGKAEMGDPDSRSISGLRKACLQGDGGCAVDDPVSFSSLKTGASTETDKGVSNGPYQLWLPSSSRTSSARRVADRPQAGLSALQRGRAGTETEEAEATEKCDGSSNFQGYSPSERTVGDGFHA